MAPEVWHRVRDLFAEAADLDAGERAQFLGTVCLPGTPERAEVERLLAGHDAAGGILETARQAPWALGDGSWELQPGTVISGRFRIVRCIARGGMGEVYEAEDLDLGGSVALKTIRAEWKDQDEALARFKREIQIARRLTHPHICRIFDGGRHAGPEGDEVVYLTMELLEGETLAARMERDGRLTLEEASPLIAQILAGLSALHDAGVIHRDLKPGNVMLARTAQGAERAVLMDFGLARSSTDAGPSGAQTATGRILGTPDYMAPEQLVGKPAGPATDLFALGALLYRMLTGEKPWPEQDRWNADAIPLRERRAELPKHWEEAIGRCLRRDPGERPQSVAEVARALGVRPAGASSAERVAIAPRGRTLDWRWAAALLLVALALLGWALRDRWQGQETVATTDTELRIALLPFEAIGGDEELASSAAGLGDVIARRLSQFNGPSGAVTVASPREVRGRGIESPSEARGQLGARMVVEGSLSGNGDEVQLTLGVVDPERLATVSSATVTDARDNLMGLERKAVARLSNMLSLRLKPDNAAAPLDLAPGAYEFYVRGLSYLERDDQLEQVELAEGLFRKALAIDPDFADARAGLAAALWQKFKRTSNPDWIGESVVEAARALALDPDQAQAHVTLGLAKNRRPETQEEALGHFERVLAAEPNNGEALEGLADTYKRMGRTEEAEAAFRDMLARRRGDWRAYKQIALFYEGQGRYEEAIGLLQDALELTPDNAEIMGTLGSTYYHKGNLDSARESYQKSIAIEPTKASLANLAIIYEADSKYLESVGLLERAVDIDRSDYRVWNNLGTMYGRIGRPTDQMRADKEADRLAVALVAADPQNASAMLHLAMRKALDGFAKGAADQAERAVSIQPKSPRILRSAAEVFVEAGDVARARDVVCQALGSGLSSRSLEDNKRLRKFKGIECP